MRLLLDTHVFLWFVSGDRKLPITLRSAVQDPSNETLLSVVSVWEAVIKHPLGKLPFPTPPAVYLPRLRLADGIGSVAVDEGVMPHLAALPPLHRDPFDRPLVAQAIQHGLTIATVDPLVVGYPVPALS